LDYSGNVSLTFGAHSFVPDIFSQVGIKQFVTIGAILTEAQGLPLHEAEKPQLACISELIAILS
jgi:hypothetical protein